MSEKVDPSIFFEVETTPDDAKARRLARQKEDETESQEAPQDGSIEAARERRMLRLREKEAQTLKEEQKTLHNHAITAPVNPSDATKDSLFYFKNNWTVELHGDKYKVFADKKVAYEFPTKPMSSDKES